MSALPPARGGNRTAAAHDVRCIDIQLDTDGNAFTSFDDARTAGIRQARQKYGVHLGLHTLSAVNVAECSPFVAEAVDRYLNCGWMRG